MLEGKCPKCGYKYVGWALRYPRHQTCTICGKGLDIFEYGHKIITGCSPLDEDEQEVIQGDQIPTSEKSKKNNRSKWNWILRASDN